MGNYRIVAAKPKGETNHLKSQFKMYEQTATGWSLIGWKTIHDVSALLKAGHQVRTGKVTSNNMSTGAPVELELRIAKNDTDYKISGMPDS